MGIEYTCANCGYSHKAKIPDKEPGTWEEVERCLIDLGFDVIQANKSNVVFWYNKSKIIYYIKKKWASGKGIEDGRGWDYLIKQITKQ